MCAKGQLEQTQERTASATNSRNIAALAAAVAWCRYQQLFHTEKIRERNVLLPLFVNSSARSDTHPPPTASFDSREECAAPSASSHPRVLQPQAAHVVTSGLHAAAAPVLTHEYRLRRRLRTVSSRS